jgi:transcription initiation factor TFIIH subunit 4
MMGTKAKANADNPLQTAVLNLFVTLKARFPNLVVGQITRESVKRALVNGITAEQVSSLFTRRCLGRSG